MKKEKQAADQKPKKNKRFEKYKLADSKWALLQSTKDVPALKEFATEFADTIFASLAVARLNELFLEMNKSKARESDTEKAARLAWNAIKNSNDTAVLGYFVKRYEKSAPAKLAKQRIAYLAEKADSQHNDTLNTDNVRIEWNKTKFRGDLYEINRFYQRHKNTEYGNLAKLEIAQLEWDKIKNSGSRIEFRNFFNKHKNTTLGNLAQIKYNRLTKFDTENRARQKNSRIALKTDNEKDQDSIRIEWNKLKFRGNKSKIRDFSRKHKNTPYGEIAKVEIDRIEWNNIKNSNSKYIFLRFSNEHPNSLHGNLAIIEYNRLSKIENKNARSIKKVGSSKPVNIAHVGRWYAFHRDTKSGKTCFIGATPAKGGVTKDVYIQSWLSNDNGDTYHRIGVEIKKKYLPVSKHSWTIGGNTFDFYIQNNWAHLRNKSTERRIVEAMKPKSQFTTQTTLKNGKIIVDRYKLNGVTATLKKIDAACPVSFQQ